MSEPESSPHIPYQAYKSKRHSRTISSPNPNFATPPISRPSSIVETPPKYRYDSSEKDPVVSSFSTGQVSEPALSATHGIPTPPESTGSHDPFDPHLQTEVPLESNSVHSVMPAASTGDNVGLPLAISSSSFTMSASSSSAPSAQDSKADATRKASRFRRVPLRSTRSPLPASPLRSDQTLAHTKSASSVSVSSLRPNVPQNLSKMDPSPVQSQSRLISTERQLPVIPPPERLAVEDDNHKARNLATDVAPSHIIIPPRTSSLHAVVFTETTSTSSRRSNAPLPHSAATAIPLPSQSHLPISHHIPRAPAPYRPGFQPKGVYRPLTDEFCTLRRIKRDGEGDGATRRAERTKLERRLEKLIALHFPPHSLGRDTKETEGGRFVSRGGSRKRPGNGVTGNEVRKASSLFDFDLKSVTMVDAGGLWRGMIGATEGGGKGDIRASEQRITPWQDDSIISKCPLCTASFHPLTNRKHHCRLCGQIVCSLPVKRPQRLTGCSLLFVVNPGTRRIEEVQEGVDYGVRRRTVGGVSTVSAGSASNIGKSAQEEVEEEKFLKGVRICRQCRPTLLRQQYYQEVAYVPTFARLYEVLVNLEKEIEESLPQFQELILSLSNDDQPTKEASAARKRLLEAFAQYDGLSKQMRNLPCVNGPGSSQDRVQMAVMTRANLFLQKNMFPLQSLPTPKRSASKTSSSPTPPLTARGPVVDLDSELAHALQPLLEQEALLESFVEEAKAHRKFEDVKTLKMNLMEIRAEIEKILANAGGMHGTHGGRGAIVKGMT